MITDSIKGELEKPLIKYGLTFALILVVMQSVILPWFDWRSQTHNELSNQGSRIVNAQTLESASTKLSERKKELMANLAEVEALFDSKLDNPRVNLPTNVREVANSYNVTISRISVAEKQLDSSLIDAFIVSMEGSASVDRIFAFVEGLESDSAFFITDRLTIYDVKSKEAKFRMELVKYVKR